MRRLLSDYIAATWLATRERATVYPHLRLPQPTTISADPEQRIVSPLDANRQNLVMDSWVVEMTAPASVQVGDILRGADGQPSGIVMQAPDDQGRAQARAVQPGDEIEIPGVGRAIVAGGAGPRVANQVIGMQLPRAHKAAYSLAALLAWQADPETHDRILQGLLDAVEVMARDLSGNPVVSLVGGGIRGSVNFATPSFGDARRVSVRLSAPVTIDVDIFESFDPGSRRMQWTYTSPGAGMGTRVDPTPPTVVDNYRPPAPRVREIQLGE